MNNTIAVSTTAFFNDRGCHIRIEQIMNRMGIRNLIAYNAGRERDNIETIRITPPRILNRDYVGFRFEKILLDIFIWKLTVLYIRKEHPDMIMAFTHEAGIIAMIAGAITHTPFVLDYQGSLSGEMQSYLSIAKMRIVKFIMGNVEHMIEEKASALIFNTLFSYNSSNKKRKYLIRDEHKPQTEHSIASFREGNEKIILWMGPLTRRQGIDELKELLTNTCNSVNKIKFVVIGHYDKLDEMRAMYPHAIFTGRVEFEYIPSIIKDADICISTKEESTEGSHKLYMYRKYGKEIIALRNKAAEEMLNDDQIVDDINEMKKRIMEIL